MPSDSLTEKPEILEMRLLGPPEVKWAGSTLSLSRRQVRALLYRLAAGQDPVPREQLCYLFWPDIPETVARRNLTGLLSHLRRTLPEPGVLVTREDLVGLHPDRTWSDMPTFTRLRAAHEASPSLELLRRAVELYHGPFLDGFSVPESPEFETWASLERQSCERSYLDALTILTDKHAASGDYHAAIAYAQRVLDVDELAEDIHRRLIELYAVTGDRSKAVGQYKQCATILERELGVEPLPETEAAYRVALEEQPPSPTLPQPERQDWTALPLLDLPLVGREGELKQLEAAFTRARSGQGSVFLISGEPGIGKSRLVQALVERWQDQALVLPGTSYPDTQMVPYHPLVEALRPALGTRHAWLQLPACHLAEAARLIPDLRSLYLELPPPLTEGPEEARTALFEALSNLVMALAAGPRPAVLFLDDLHWADSTTLDWLTHLGRRLWDSRLLVVGTYSSEAAEHAAGLRHGLARQGLLTEIALHKLDEDAVRQLLQPLGDAVPASEAWVERLDQVTGGNPFFLLETMQALVASGRTAEDLDAGGDLPLPDTIREAVHIRVERLSSRARQVLEAGAVLGRSFSFDLVHLTAGRRQMETVDGLDELLARQLLAEETDVFHFRHEVIRWVVYQALSQRRRRVLHRRAGEALERQRSTDVAALARHFEQAQQPGRAAAYAVRAGEAAKTVFAPVEARAYFDRALALLEQEAVELRNPEAMAANRRWRIQTLYDRGWALRILGEMDAYLESLQEEARLATLLGDPRSMAHLDFRLAYTRRWFCDYGQALQSAREALHLSQELGDRALEARCWRELGIVAQETGAYQEAERALERSLALARDTGDPELEVHLLGNLATLHWYRGEHETSLALSRRALARCDEAELPFHRRIPLGDMGAAAAAIGDFELARASLEESLSIARDTADRSQEILCLLHLGWLDVRLNRPNEALAHLGAGLALAETIGSCTEQGRLLSAMAEALWLVGNGEQALAHAERALAHAQATGRPYDEELASGVLGQLTEG